MAEWARIANTTIKKYLREEEPAIMRNRKVLAMIEKRGNVLYNQGGDGIDWKVRYRRAAMQVNDGEQAVSISRKNRHLTATLDYAGYLTEDRITKREKLKNQSNEAIIKLFANLAKFATEDLRDQFSEEIYVDSSASGNSGRMTGLESMFACTQTLNVSTGVARTADAADPTGVPDDTYAGIDTDLGAEGGTWTSGDINSTWPFGRGDAHYDFWSPLIVNYASTAFLGGTNDTWAENCEEAMRFLIDGINSRNKGGAGQVDMLLLDRGLYREAKSFLTDKERIVIGSNLELRSMGFRDVFEFDGVEVTTEYGVPAAVGYALNMEAVEFRSMQDSLFDVTGPKQTDLETRDWQLVVDILGQFKFESPRMFGKLKDIA